jgi:hypothetical protein
MAPQSGIRRRRLRPEDGPDLLLVPVGDPCSSRNFDTRPAGQDVGVPPEEAESSARAKQGANDVHHLHTPSIPAPRPVRQLHGIQYVVMLAYRRKRRNRRPGAKQGANDVHHLHTPSIPAPRPGQLQLHGILKDVPLAYRLNPPSILGASTTAATHQPYRRRAWY